MIVKQSIIIGTITLFIMKEFHIILSHLINSRSEDWKVSP